MQPGQPLPFLNFPFHFSWNNARTTHMDFKFLFLGIFRKFPPGVKGWGRGCRSWPRVGPSAPLCGQRRAGAGLLALAVGAPWFLHLPVLPFPSCASRVGQVALVVKNPPGNAGDIRDAGSIAGSGRSPGEGNGNPLQYSCLENSYGQKSLAGYSP